jgi:hypothetical protein
MSDVDLPAAYIEARRQFVEKKFTPDTHRARLEWIKAKMFTGSSGGGPRRLVRRSQKDAMVERCRCKAQLRDRQHRLGRPDRLQCQRERLSAGRSRRLREEHRVDQWIGTHKNYDKIDVKEVQHDG